MQHRLTYLTTGLARAGAETQLLLLCESFVKAGWEVNVISLLKPEAYLDELARMGVQVLSLNLSKARPNPFALFHLVRALRAFQPDILHCHQVHANLAGRIARLFLDIPTLICTAHSITEGPRWREWAYRFTDSLCDLTTNVCQAGADRYVRVRAVPASKMRYVPNAIDVSRYSKPSVFRTEMRKALGVPSDSFVWFAAGNLRPAKDYPTMVEAFRLLSAAEPKARLLIAGMGPLAAELSNRISEQEIHGVSFLGARSDVRDLLHAVDGFLMSSAWEGTPLALLEAGAASLPVVATRVGGVPEIVENGSTGFLVPSGDPTRMAEVCLGVMRLTPEQRTALGSALKEAVEAKFSIDTVSKQWQELYGEVNEGRPWRTEGRPQSVKIVHILGDSKYGGAAKSIIRLTQLWRNAGWDVRILTTDPQFQEAAANAGVATVNVDCVWREIRPLRDLVGLFRLWRYLRAERFTVAHTHTTKAGFVGRIAARLAGVPTVIHTVHGFAFHERSSRLKIAAYALLERIAGLFCDRIITVSEFHLNWARRLRIAGPNKLVAIPNGIPDSAVTSPEKRRSLRAELGVADPEILVFTAGRVVPEKGLGELVEAIGILPLAVKGRLRVIIAGDGPILPHLARRANELELSGRVRFLGYRDDIPALLGACDIVALPSWREGLSIALLESMCAGRAIIASNIGSNLEALGAREENGPAALCVEPGDVPALAAALIRLTGDRALREKLGRYARTLWERHYTVDRTLSTHERTYLDILSARGRMRPQRRAASAGSPQ